MEGMLANSMAVVLGSLGQYKAAVESEKRAYQFYAGLLGEEHELTKQCSTSLQVSSGFRNVPFRRVVRLD
jgi:hypothetical protein